MGLTEHTIQIELEGLIKLLAQNLYADPDVFLREMIQNAHDSITKRRELAAERGERDIPAGAIHIDFDRTGQRLTISDNGSGLTREEIPRLFVHDWTLGYPRTEGSAPGRRP